jgi:4-amino-4-deoxy-L-arabinose transferase-like glycosyltransferase
MRWEAWAWWMILPRLVVDVAAIVGVFLVAIGVSTFLYDRVRANPSGLTVIWLWCVGAIAYLMIFFNLNRVHDYYQIPFLAPAAVLLALGIDRIARAVATRDAHTYSIVSGVAVAVLVVASVAIAETRYYRHDDVRLAAGEVIGNTTPRGGLVIAAAPSSDPRDPQLLYYAHRYGWPIDTALLTIPIVHALQKEGATHLAVLGNPPASLGDVRRLCIEPVEQPIGDTRLTVCALRSATGS